MNATEFWTKTWGEPETDSDKLAIAMMAEFEEHQTKELKDLLKDRDKTVTNLMKKLLNKQ